MKKLSFAIVSFVALGVLCGFTPASPKQSEKLSLHTQTMIGAYATNESEVRIPNLVGYSFDEAQAILEKMNMRVLITK